MIYETQNVIAQIRGWELIIALAFIFLFIPFWRELTRERKDSRETRQQAESSVGALVQRSTAAEGEAMPLSVKAEVAGSTNGSSGNGHRQPVRAHEPTPPEKVPAHREG